MTPSQVIKHFGGPKASVHITARRLECTAQAIYKWIAANRVPLLRQAAIHELSGGKLKADRK